MINKQSSSASVIQGGFVNVMPGTPPQLQNLVPVPQPEPERVKRKVQHDSSSQIAYYPTLNRRDNCDDLTRLLLNSTHKEYYTLLQHPFYYQSLNDLSYESSLSTVSSTTTRRREVSFFQQGSDQQGQKTAFGGAIPKQDNPFIISKIVKTDNDQSSILSKLETPQMQPQQTENNLMQCVSETPAITADHKMHDVGEVNDNDEEEELEEIYIEMFGNHKRKETRQGVNYQVQQIPHVTDVQYFEYLEDLDQYNQEACQLMWDPNRLPSDEVDYYLQNMEMVWPYELFHYQEEVALHFLHLKNYDVHLALTTALYNQDQLVKLLLLSRKKRRAQSLLTNILMKQHQKATATNNRVLRERGRPNYDYEELDMMLRHQSAKIEDYE